MNNNNIKEPIIVCNCNILLVEWLRQQFAVGILAIPEQKQTIQRNVLGKKKKKRIVATFIVKLLLRKMLSMVGKILLTVSQLFSSFYFLKNLPLSLMFWGLGVF